MPLLLPKIDDTYDRNMVKKEREDQKGFKDELKSAVKKRQESEEQDSTQEQPNSLNKGNGDEVDGSPCLNNQLGSYEFLPAFAKDRLIDGIKEILEEKSNF